MTLNDLATLLIGPSGAVIVEAVVIYFLYRENTQLRKGSMDLLEKYQSRDEEERKLRMEEERDRRRAGGTP